MRRADVAVVGGGVIGASIAYALAARRAGRVVLLEKGALASGASGRSSALVRMHYTNEWDARLAWASFPLFRDWKEAMGGPAVFTQTGFLNIVAPEYADNLRRNVDMLRALGIDTVALAPDDVKALQPFLKVEDVGAAAYEPGSGYVSPAEVVEGFRRRAEELGATVLQWTPVTRILLAGRRVVGVDTTDGRLEAGAVVLAAGAWSPGLCRAIGIDIPARVKGVDTAVIARPPELAESHMCVIDNIQGTYVRPETGALTIVGIPCQAWDVDPDNLSTALPEGATDEAARILMHRIPSMERASVMRGFRAFDCYSADRHAILDRVEGVDGLYLATAFSGAGFKIAPAVGTCMAELILDGQAKMVDISAFGLRRFAEKRSLDGPYPYAVRRDHVDPAQANGGA